MSEIKIEIDEAKRRAESMLVRQGYRMMGQWVEKFYDDEKESIWSMALVGLPHTRLLLYPERDHWRSVVSIGVGRHGEFPICTGFIERNRDKFMPSFGVMEGEIVTARQQITRWDFTAANTYSAQALARLTELFMTKKHYRKARITNSMIITGKINAATVSEALSMVQTVVAKTREDRLESALIWKEVYR